MKIIRTRQAQKIRVANGWQCRTCFVFQTILVSTILCHTPIEKFMASLCQMARPDQTLAMWVRESRRLRRVHFWGLTVEENCESFSHWGNVKKNLSHLLCNGIPNSGFTCWKKNPEWQGWYNPLHNRNNQGFVHCHSLTYRRMKAE